MHITSAQNSRIKLVNRLRNKRGRESEARFVIDYERDFQRALEQGYVADFILYDPELVSGVDGLNCETYQVTPELLKRSSYRENPDGIVAVMRSKSGNDLTHLEAAEFDSALVLVDLRVPGNVGALLRSADAAGMDAIILVDTALDLYNPNVIRSSTGACFLNNIYLLDGGETLSYLTSRGFQIVAADVSGAGTLYDLDFRQKTAIVLGTEDKGLDLPWIDHAHRVARIPMDGKVSDSLNVSVSGAIFMYELHRQRRLG